VGLSLLLVGFAAAILLAPAAAPAGAPGLVAAYGFDETGGSTAADSSGTGNTGSISGAVSSASGKFGRALSFDGVNDIVSVADSNSLDLTTGMTLEAWVNPQGADWRTVLLKERPSGLAYALYASTDTGRPSAEVRTATTAETRGPAALPSGWSHLATTYDGATLRLYVNGTQVSSQARSGSIEVGTGLLRIGGNLVWGEYFNGLIDELRIYNRALTATEIQTDMATPIATPNDSQPPTAPGGLTASVSGDDVQLSWTASSDNTGVTGYRVHRSATAGFTPDAGNLVATSATAAYLDPDRPIGSWHYRVIAVDAAGNASAPSAQATVSIVSDSQPPSAPGNLAATVSAGNVQLTWSASSDNVGVTGYRVWESGAPGFTPGGNTSTLLATLGGGTTSYVHANRPIGTFNYRIVAFDAAGNSSASSAEVAATVPGTDAAAPSAPSYLTATVSGGVVNLAWMPSTDDVGVLSYRIYRSTTPDFWPYAPGNWLASVAGGTTSYADNVNLAGGDVYYKVIAHDALYNFSLPSNEVRATLDADTTPPTVSINNACDGAVAYSEYFDVNVPVSDDRGAVDLRVLVDGLQVWSSGSFPVSGPFVRFTWSTRNSVSNGLHVMTAIARDGGGNETTSAPCTWLIHNKVLTVPIVSPADGATVSGVVTLDADPRGDGAPLSATGVAFTATGLANGFTTSGSGYSTSWDTRALPNGVYTIEAKLYHLDYSNPQATTTIQVTVDNSPSAPSAPGNLTTTVWSGDDVGLGWDASTGGAGVTSYRVYRDDTLIATRSASLQRVYTDIDVPVGTYHYKVVAVDAAGTAGPPSNEAAVTVQADTTPPTVSVTDYGPPLCSRAVGDYVYLRPTISDDRGPVTYHLELDGATVFGPRTVFESDPLFYFTTFQEFWWDTRATPPGQHVMIAYARDGAGNEAASEPCVWTVGPLSVPITSPAAGATVSGTVLVNAQPLAGAQVPKEIDINSVSFSVDGVTKGGDDATPYQFSWDTTKIGNGVHTLKVDLYWTDNPNKPTPSVASSTIQVTVANVVPKPTGLAATVETVDDVRLTWDAPTEDSVDNFKLYRSATAGFTPSPDTFLKLVDGGLTSTYDVDRPSGPWYYRLVAIGYGSGPGYPPAESAPSDQAVATVEQDTSPPTVKFNHPCDGSVSGVDMVRVSLTVSDDRGGSFLQVVMEGKTLHSFPQPWIQGPDVYFDWWTFPSWPDGLHDMVAIATDQSGNVTTTPPCTFRVDNPDFSITFTSPTDGAIVSGITTFASDKRADGVPVTWGGNSYFVDTTWMNTDADTSTPGLQWDTRTVMNGEHTLTAAFYWNGPTAASTTIRVTVRNPIPQPTGFSAAVTQDDVRLSWTASPVNSAVSGYRVYRSTTAGFTPSDSNLIATTTAPTYDDLNRPPGTYRYRVVAFSTNDVSPPSPEVTANVNSLTGLVAALGFEEAAGTVALDSSGSGNTGTINGPTRTASGKFGRAVTFDGINDLVTIADAASLDLTTGMTIEAWVWSSLGTNWRTVLIKERPGGLAYALYAATDTGRPGAFVDTNAESDARGTANLQLQVWTHLTGTYDGTTLRFYVNGALISSRAVTGALRVTTGALQLGGNTIWSEWFKGRIDEVRIYNRALSAAEIAVDRDNPVGAP
jgi:fibronectin type 3 domain-containing protein